MNYKLLLAALFATTLGMTSCSKDEDPEIPNEEEVITTVNYTLTPVGSGAPVTFTFRDLDGDGGDAPVITSGVLAANTTYTGSLELLNEQESPAEDITEEIKEEDEEHQFFFSNTATDVTVTYQDQDADGNPVGLETELTTVGATTGEMTIILRHEPNKSASGVAGGIIDNAGGETDIEVTFDLDVQ